MVSVSLVRCKNEALKKLYFKSIIKCFKRVKIDQWPEWPRFTMYSFSPIDYCVRINALPARLFSGDISVIDFLIVTASISKLLHSWLFIDLSEHHYTALTSKFKKKFNRSATMLNNVFNVKKTHWITVLYVSMYQPISCMKIKVSIDGPFIKYISFTEISHYRGKVKIYRQHIHCTWHTLKPQDSFGGFDKNKLWSSESTPNHQKAPSNPPKIVLNDMF